jgi:aminopeptidase N
MIRAQLGDDLWWKAIARYVADNAMRNVETVDLARAIEEVSGLNFAPFFDQWVLHAGHPDFDVAYEWDAGAKLAAVTVSQSQTVDDHTPLFKVPVAIEFGMADGASERFEEMGDARHGRFIRFARSLTCVFDPGRSSRRQRAAQRCSPSSSPSIPTSSRGRRAPWATTARRKRGRSRARRARPFWGVQAEAAKSLGRIREHAFDRCRKRRRSNIQRAPPWLRRWENSERRGVARSGRWRGRTRRIRRSRGRDGDREDARKAALACVAVAGEELVERGHPPRRAAGYRARR